MNIYGVVIIALCSVAVLAPPAGLQAADPGTLVTKPSRYSVPETIDRIARAVESKGMKVFATIDHGAEAAAVGLQMPPTVLLIFGNPKGGTALMLARPTVAIDLPMKALAWQDAEGKVWLTYNRSSLLQERHGLPQDFAIRLAPIEELLTRVVE